MNVLAVDLKSTVISLLRSKNISMFTDESILTTHNLEQWLKSGIYDACVIVIKRNGFGLSVARALRSKGINTPLIGVVESFTERSWSDYRAAFLEQGGDDLLHDLNPRELSASLQAIARRMELSTQDKFEYRFESAHLVVDNLSYQVTLNDIPVLLTAKEMELLQLFTKTPDRVFSRDAIIASMYADRQPESNVVASLVSRLRIKLKTVHPDGAKLIKPIAGKGYLFQAQKSIH